MAILKMFTKEVLYSSKTEDKSYAGRVVLCDCTFRQTSYGSVIIARPSLSHIVELYPSKIEHIIHSK